MATDDSRRKCQAVTVGLLEEARARAQEFLRELAAMSDTTQRQAQGAFDELIDGGRKSTELLLGFLSKEVSAQLAQFGFSPGMDLETLVRRFVGFPPGPMTWRRTGEPADPAARANDEPAREQPAREQPAREQPASRATPGESSSRAGGEPATTRPGGDDGAERHRGSSGETQPGRPEQTAATEKAVVEPAPGLKAAAAKKTPGQKATAQKATAKQAPGEKAAGPKKAPAAGAAAKKTAGRTVGAKKSAGATKTGGRGASTISSAPAKAAPRRESPARADAPTPAPATDQAVPEG
jgi:hypothetical protein